MSTVLRLLVLSSKWNQQELARQIFPGNFHRLAKGKAGHPVPLAARAAGASGRLPNMKRAKKHLPACTCNTPSEALRYGRETPYWDRRQGAAGRCSGLSVYISCHDIICRDNKSMLSCPGTTGGGGL